MRRSRERVPIARSIGALVGCLLPCIAAAAGYFVDNTTIAVVAVHGGADTANPGTTCITITNPVVAACPTGLVAIRNNNQLLVSAAQSHKLGGTRIRLYYDDAGGPFHCPGLALTPCSVVNIESR